MTVNSATRDRLKAHMRKRDINPLAERNDLPSGFVHEDKIPVSGSVHLTMGRAIEAKIIDKHFNRAKHC